MRKFRSKTGQPFLVLVLLFGSLSVASAQNFSSGSNGSDGALTFPANAGEVIFDPESFNPKLDTDGDNIYHFTTITIPQGTTVRLTAGMLGEGKPVHWLASGDVTIDGILDLNGENGHALADAHNPSMAGAGGYSGGRGYSSSTPTQFGNGPGGGVNTGNGHGSFSSGSKIYGNEFLLPLVGGSGGGGHSGSSGQIHAGGGAGGGAILIASTTKISISGTVQANGGHRGTSGAGSGSGGAIRLVSTRIEGAGSITALGGQFASPGRIRIEAFRYNRTLQGSSGHSISVPGTLFLPATAPLIKVTTIGTVTVSSDPTGSLVTPDATVNVSAPVTITIEARNIPLGTVLKLKLMPQTGTPIEVDTTPLTGTVQASTATVSVTLPAGFSHLFVKASWTP